MTDKEQYEKDCCVLCFRHLQKVRSYPAMCGMCRESNFQPEYKNRYPNQHRYEDFAKTEPCQT